MKVFSIRRMVMFLIAALTAVSCLAVSVPAQKAPPKPAPRKKPLTIRGEVASPAKPEPKTYGLVVERYATTYHLASDGTASQTIELRQKCSSELCLGQVSKARFEFIEEFHDIKVTHASIVKAKGERTNLDVSLFKSRPTPQAEAAPGFSSLREVEIQFKDVAVNDTVAIGLTFDTRKPLFQNHFDSIEFFSRMFEWKSIEINIEAPKGQRLFFEPIGLEGGEIPESGERAKWQFKKADVAPLQIEAAMFDPLSISPRLVISTYPNYDELARSFGSGVAAKAIVTDEVKTLADEITKGIKEPQEKAAAIYSWVNKNIRYLAVVLDRGGWVPHSTTEILRNRYGDCKDYTTLIHALLKAKGIDSIPVLIRSDFLGWFPKVPATEYFNHAILYIPSLNVFADATVPNTRLGIFPQTLVGKMGVLAGERVGLIELPKNDPNDNQLHSEIDITLSENGALKGTSTNRYSGRMEMIMRPIFGVFERNPDTFMKLLLAYLGVGGTGKIVSVSDPHSVRDPFEVKLEVDIKDFTTFLPKGKFELPIGLNLFTPAELEALTNDESRQTDLHAGAIKLKEIFRITLPDQVSIPELPEMQKVSNEVGDYILTAKKVDGKIEITRDIVLKKDVLTPGEYPALKQLVSKAVEGLNTSIHFTADPLLLRNKSKSLKQRTAKAKPEPSGLEALYNALKPETSKKLTLAQVRQLEAKLVKSPDDTESRSKLIDHYSRYDVKETPLIVKARTGHRLWFVKTRPDLDETTFLRLFSPYDMTLTPEYRTLRDEWQKQLAARSTAKRIRINSADFIRPVEPELAEKIVRDGIALDPTSYELTTKLARYLVADLNKLREKKPSEPVKEASDRALAAGRQALKLIKQERSDDRDEARGGILVSLAPIALEASDLELAEELARELVLDFGFDASEGLFETATHVGNSIIGRVYLQKGNIEKAKEHLLISIRAPLRDTSGYFSDIDFQLARDLFKKGEAKAVGEFLGLCLELNAFTSEPEIYEDEINAIKKWKAEVEKGVEPSFDFEKP